MRSSRPSDITRIRESLPTPAPCPHPAHWCIAVVAGGLALCSPSHGFEQVRTGPLALDPSLNLRLGAQYGTGINYGFGAIDAPGETERAASSFSIKPRLGLLWPDAPAGELYGGISLVGAGTLLDGEIGGQFARAGDTAIDTDEAHVGWRKGVLDVSVGAQEYWIGDGFLIGDGNFDVGARDGQFWNFPFAAWRNSAIARLRTDTLNAEAFWLRSDRDFGDSRIAGFNAENAPGEHGYIIGVSYFEIFDAKGLNHDGLKVWNLRFHDIKVPFVPPLEFWSELVWQGGTDDLAGGRRNDAFGWYLEGAWTFARLPWAPVLSYRYIRLPGDDLGTPENETFRGLFYTFYKREWDTWYQGEIAGEYHLFNSNQITQMAKLRAFPRENWATTVYYYRHDLEQPHFYGTPLSSRAWADEVNLSVEYFGGDKFYGYAGLAWSKPDRGAREFFGGDDDFTVVQTFLMYTF